MANIPFQHRVRSDDIEVLLVVNSKELASLKLTDPFSFLFRQLKSDLKHLIDNGITVQTEKGPKLIFPTISSIVADNLGAYEILGFKKSFQNNAFWCRFCGSTGKVSATEFSIQDVNEKRPLLEADTITETERKNLATKRTFAFEGLDGLTQFNCAPCDIFHDLPEGTLTDALELILNSLCISTKKDGKLKFHLDRSRNRATEKSNRNIIISRFEEHDFQEGKCGLNWSSNGFSLTGKGIAVSI